MNVGAANNQYAQMHMNQMGGKAQGGNQGGMKDVMQNLSSDDRAVIQEQMQSLSKEDKLAMKEQLKQVDSTSMSSDEYFNSLLDILNQDDTQSTSTSFSVYA